MSDTPANVPVDPRIERTRKVVLDAAAELIGEVGFGRTTIEAISERSGVARSTIYRHWEELPALLVDAIDCKIAQLSLQRTGDLRADLMAMLNEVAERMTSPETGPMMISLLAEARRDPQMATMLQRFTGARFGRIRSILEEAVKRGDLSVEADLERMTEDLAAPLFFRALIRLAPVDEPFVEQHVDRWIDRYRS